ncbi:neurotensin receptor type 1-like [Sinocyclocheilus grahami]|uniref:neurotensin receptor type 1-like n=1 Tax=Sinocyclocheilus grahami TaxID=75366 RepID=UPI0007AD348B|nr:PREDICTED: neurotensin receptor type 1-like [Sinocyclocheilus grahami]
MTELWNRVLENRTQQCPLNSTDSPPLDDLDVNTDIYSKVLVTLIYAVLFAVGLIGNSMTLYISLHWRSIRHLQSTVHYHLASLAVSDLLILLLCMPVELYNFIWIHHPWAFGEVVCRSYYFLRDGCSYATAFNIVSLSVERYVALCHPFKAKSRMSRGRTRRLICALWCASLILASPMLLTMGQLYVGEESICTIVASSNTARTVLQVNALLSFVVPMLVITVMNGLIGHQLQRMTHHDLYCSVASDHSVTTEKNRERSLRHGVKVLRGVVFAFVLCWFPYHCRRLMYCYVTGWTNALYDFYHYFYMVTNVLFYVSSVINPILYNLVSSNYRQVFFSTVTYFCHMHSKRQRTNQSKRSLQLPQQLQSSLVTPRNSQQTLCPMVIMDTMY